MHAKCLKHSTVYKSLKKFSYYRCLKHKNTPFLSWALAFSSLCPFWKEKSIRRFLYLSFLSQFKNSNHTGRHEQNMLCPCQGREKVNLGLQEKRAGEADRMSPVGGVARMNLSYHSSFTVQFRLPLLPAPRSSLDSEMEDCSGGWGGGGRWAIILQPSTHCLFQWIRDDYAQLKKYPKHYKY